MPPAAPVAGTLCCLDGEPFVYHTINGSSDSPGHFTTGNSLCIPSTGCAGWGTLSNRGCFSVQGCDPALSAPTQNCTAGTPQDGIVWNLGGNPDLGDLVRAHFDMVNGDIYLFSSPITTDPVVPYTTVGADCSQSDPRTDLLIEECPGFARVHLVDKASWDQVPHGIACLTIAAYKYVEVHAVVPGMARAQATESFTSPTFLPHTFGFPVRGGEAVRLRYDAWIGESDYWDGQRLIGDAVVTDHEGNPMNDAVSQIVPCNGIRDYYIPLSVIDDHGCPGT